ncbi:cobalamin biosynthesis protein CobW [Methylopila jiangsuensis]|uniref:Cobalamin biosynthesis protein CobW n=1 Tax=Methylopila jiangsuensis TaxID=586230 RepID=A0A9W6JGT5_9HYPH|nr:cobalamin biosynthesis protein CobW [Methylopila jiangsuensis]MDR6285520.1 cobalamin biosynthesis protein CobW [Methylopila jiangsuensis]GLK75278.1 cobalamin biosynthesis protein CobW [Methylopila jiangsuensis]
MTAPHKIPATVVTGFLGAGKTTLIRHLLQNAGGRKIALIVNEFGDVGIDGEVLKACGSEACREEDIVELANGCICCTVADDFIPTMEKILARAEAPDHIVIETSGLALPQPLVRAFRWPEIATRVTVDGVVTVVDGPAVRDGRFAHDEAAVAAQRAADPNLDHEDPIEELFEDQLRAADLILIHKADQLAAGEADAVKAQVLEHASEGVRVVSAANGDISADVLLGIASGVEDKIDGRPTTHEMEGEVQHDHDDFVSFIAETPEAADAAELEARVRKVLDAHDVLRLKGFAPVADKAARLVVQAVGTRVDAYFDRPWKDGEARRGRLVVIAEKGVDEAAIKAALKG